MKKFKKGLGTSFDLIPSSKKSFLNEIETTMFKVENIFYNTSNFGKSIFLKLSVHLIKELVIKYIEKLVYNNNDKFKPSTEVYK